MKGKAKKAESRKLSASDLQNSKWILRLLASIFVMTFFVPVSGQKIKYIFNHLGLEEGLSNLNISSFAKDELGFIWIGTEDGLNRFDGTNLKVFKTVPGDSSNSISNNNISALLAREHYLFMGSMGNGIDRYNGCTTNFHYAA
jgi:hypothetical protein